MGEESNQVSKFGPRGRWGENYNFRVYAEVRGGITQNHGLGGWLGNEHWHAWCPCWWCTIVLRLRAARDKVLAVRSSRSLEMTSSCPSTLLSHSAITRFLTWLLTRQRADLSLSCRSQIGRWHPSAVGFTCTWWGNWWPKAWRTAPAAEDSGF